MARRRDRIIARHVGAGCVHPRPLRPRRRRRRHEEAREERGGGRGPVRGRGRRPTPEAQLPQHQQAHPRLAHVPLPATAEAHVAEERVGEPSLGRFPAVRDVPEVSLRICSASSSRTMSRQVVSSTSGEPATTPTKAVPSTVGSPPRRGPGASGRCHAPRKGRGEEREVLFSRGDEATVGPAPAASSAAMRAPDASQAASRSWQQRHSSRGPGA